jgi:hypothetical protein
LAVNLALYPDVSTCFQLQIASLFGGIELIGKRAFDIAWRSVVTLNQIGVVAVHHPNEISETGS